LNENDPVLAVSLSAPPEKWPTLPKYELPSFVPIPHFFMHQFSQMRLGRALESMTQSLELMINMITWLRLKEDKPDVLINPAVYKYSMIEDVDVDILIKLGEQAVIQKIKEISNAYTLSRRIRRWIRASNNPGKFLDLPGSIETE
jgi:hypothetical protein